MSIKEDYYNKFRNKDKMLKEMEKIKTNPSKTQRISAIDKYFLLDLMADTKIKKYTINELFNNPKDLQFLLDYFKEKPKFFPPGDDKILSNLAQAFRFGTYNLAALPSNFPMYRVKEIINKYNPDEGKPGHNKYYDFSAGWAARMLGALTSDFEYYATEPNDKLVPRLETIQKVFDKVNGTSSKIDIRCTGSEIYHKDWENTIGVAFSSPPYFDIEDYGHGDQSIKSFPDYKDWLEGYWRKTVQNIHKYLVQDGYLLVNIKNNKKYKMFDDFLRIATEEGFELQGYESIKISARPNNASTNKDTDKKVSTKGSEEIMVLKRGE